MTKLTVITPPAEEPIALAAAKDYLRIGHDGEDDLVLQLIQGARARIEQEAALALVEQTLQIAWSSWPAALAGRGARLPRRPAKTLISVRSIDAEAAETDLTDRFRLECGRLGLRPWSLLPAIDTGGHVDVVYQAGFGASESVPDDLKEAVLRLVSLSYHSRNASSAPTNLDAPLPSDVRSILDARREVRL